MSPTTVPESLPLHPLKLYTIPKSDVEVHTRYRSGSQSSENDPVIEPHQYLQGHETDNGGSPSAPDRRVLPHFTLTILLLSSSALLPIILGVLFYLSLGLGAPHGQHLENGTYVRPQEEGILPNGTGTWVDRYIKFSPLLIGTVSSTLISLTVPCAMSLLAFHVAHGWIRASDTPQNLDTLPTPYQYFLTMDFINNSGPFSLLRFLGYAVKSGTSQVKIIKCKSTHRARFSKMLQGSLAGFLMMMSLTWSVKLVDVILHQRILPVTQIINVSGKFIKSNAVMNCQENVHECDVVHRSLNASLGSQNESQEFKVYKTTDQHRGNIAFIGPPGPLDNLTIKSPQNPKTFAVGTICEAFHPSCEVDNHVIKICRPAGSAPRVVGLGNALIHDHGFNTSDLRQRLQSFVPFNGTRAPLKNVSSSNGAPTNPFMISSFGCFRNYAQIDYDNLNTSYHTPFIDWWTYGDPQKPKSPKYMCTILICDTTVYEVEYNLTEGNLKLIDYTFKQSNASATLAISGAATYLFDNNTDEYRYAARFAEEQLQVDLTRIGNRDGNRTEKFAAAWAQAISNRLVGWSAGAIHLDSLPANSAESVLAISIPLSTAYVFVGLLWAIAGFIILLGLSTMFLPGVVSGRTLKPRPSNGDHYLQFPQLQATGLYHAHDFLSDPTRLIHELIDSKRKPLAPNSSSSTLQPLLEDSNPRNGSLGRRSLTSINSRPLVTEGEHLRVTLVRDPSGVAVLSFS